MDWKRKIKEQNESLASSYMISFLILCTLVLFCTLQRLNKRQNEQVHYRQWSKWLKFNTNTNAIAFACVIKQNRKVMPSGRQIISEICWRLNCIQRQSYFQEDIIGHVDWGTGNEDNNTQKAFKTLFLGNCYWFKPHCNINPEQQNIGAGVGCTAFHRGFFFLLEVSFGQVPAAPVNICTSTTNIACTSTCRWIRLGNGQDSALVIAEPTPFLICSPHPSPSSPSTLSTPPTNPLAPL